ncbi:glycoside hydrolase family 2 TIM barrel-domain containing protein [Tunturiibacter gelidoferens]|uniref:Beta-galactosidase n=1 Tax=Tunturiibacter lichenicola TaxID=2051959 RepID=A0A7Y9T3R8_9BACT|nr:glycoside hydrolase family 2 TIM barrel-domain containing protein [Edaphobacter lichenicola]NYF52691.1 beta-galactosidase [Edaphobacter lichenicola]
MYSRRNFLKTGATAVAASWLPALPLQASIATLGRNTNPAADTPHTRRLSEGWEFLQGSLGSPWEAWHSEEVAVWQPIAMPHCFNAYDGCDPDIPYYRGNGWYRSHVPIANPFPNGRTLLHFEGAGQTNTVYVGEKLAGKHTGGYDEFVFDITDLLPDASQTAADPASAPTKPKVKKPAGIPISILCDNSRDQDRMPSDLSDFSLYGGMYRHVNLVYVPAVSLETVHIRTDLPTPGSPAKITILGSLHNPASSSDQLNLSIEVIDAKGTLVHQSTHKLPPWHDTAELTSFTIAKPQLWSPANPQLYECHITLHASAANSADADYTARETFGIRHTEFVQHGPFKFNGERLLLRGTHRHEDHAGFAAAMPDDLINQEMQLIKDMGVNFIRLAHYQQSRRVLEHCDRLGILVWEEIPWCRGGIGNDTFQEMGRRTLRNMIAQHYNHPSILLWGLGNEDDWPTEYPDVNQQAIRTYLQELNTLSHQLDPSRLTTIRRCDFARDIPDVYSPSIWAGWYRGTYPEYQKTLETERERVNHLFHAEWGADSHAGRHSEDPDKVLGKIVTGKGTDERGMDYLLTGGQTRVSKDGDWSETYACNLFDWYLKTQETLPWLTGSAQWIFKDFTTPLRVENPIPRINQKGLIERDMTKKESYFVFQSYWTEVPMAHIYGHTWPIRWGTEGEQKMVKVYSNCDTAELFVNGKSAGTKQRSSQDFPAAGLRWTTPFATGKNTLRVVATKAGKTITDEITFIYQTEPWGAPADLKLTERSRTTIDGKETVTVEAKLYDAKGILCLDARNRLRFTIAGLGTLIDNRGTTKASRVVEMSNGRAEITIIRNNSSSVVSVTTPGMQAAFYTIP